MNKYQEALYTLTDWFHSYCDSNGERVHEKRIDENYLKAKETLQELVDISSRPTIIYGDENTCVVNLERIDKLEKALDKACKVIAHTDACWDLSEDSCDYECKNCWKKYLLREEE